MAKATVEMKFVSVGLEDPTADQVEMQIEWAKMNGIDPLEVASPCLVNLTTRTILARHRILKDGHMQIDGDSILSEDRKHPLLIDPPEEICRRG